MKEENKYTYAKKDKNGSMRKVYINACRNYFFYKNKIYSTLFHIYYVTYTNITFNT